MKSSLWNAISLENIYCKETQSVFYDILFVEERA